MAGEIKMIIQDVQSPQDFIEIDSWETPTKSRGVTYEDVPIRGRSEPYVFYAYTGPQIWNFTVHLVASFNARDNGIPVGVREKESFIESLVMPDYGSTPGGLAAIRPPHLARIRILRMIDVIGTIRDPQWNYEPPYDVATGNPYQIDCSFQFYAQKEFGRSPDGFADIRKLTARGQNRFS